MKSEMQILRFYLVGCVANFDICELSFFLIFFTNSTAGTLNFKMAATAVHLIRSSRTFSYICIAFIYVFTLSEQTHGDPVNLKVPVPISLENLFSLKRGQEETLLTDRNAIFRSHL